MGSEIMDNSLKINVLLIPEEGQHLFISEMMIGFGDVSGG